MSGSYKIIYRGGSGEIVEKKSRFLATIRPANTEEDALAVIAEVKKQYFDASHNCYAYVIGRNSELSRYSDDGEPSQTAGKPMLDVLQGEQLHNACAVVTRYFGGTLLGTGGLVRAYQSALKTGLANCTILEKQPGRKYQVTTDYSGAGKLSYITSQMQLVVLNTEYTDTVTTSLVLPPSKEASFCKKITDITAGQAVLLPEEELYYAELDGETLLFST